MSRSPRVSIGLPVYNAQRYLASAIEAHLVQTDGDFELVISDNGSTDGTPDLCANYARADSRVRLHRSPINQGLNWNHRQVFVLSRGEFFRWSAADDLPAPDLLSAALAHFARDPGLIGVLPTIRNIGADDEPLPTTLETLDLMSADALARVRSVLVDTYQMTYLQGLMRRSVLASTSMGWSYVGYDFVLLLELALRGRCLRPADVVLRRRLHEGQATRALHSAGTMAAFEPKVSGIAFPQIRWATERLRAVLVAPLPTATRLRVAGLVLRHAWWCRKLMGRDIARSLRVLLGRSNETAYRL